MEYTNQRQSNSAYQIRTALRRLNFSNIKEERFMDVCFIEAEKIDGNFSVEIGPRGGKNILSVPNGYTKKQFK